MTNKTNNEDLANSNNEDLLKVENLEQNEYLVSSSIIDVPEDKTEKKELKVSVFRLILYALAPAKNESQPLFYSLRPIKTVRYALFCIIFSIFVYFCRNFVDAKTFIPLYLVFASTAFPLMFITFHYELNLRRNISIFQMLFSFLFGLVLNLMIKGLSDSLLVQSIYQDTIDIFIVPLLWGVGQVLFLAIFSKIYGITDVSTNILLAVCVGMGYAFFNSMNGLYSSLYRSVEIIVPGSDNYVGQAIVDYSLYMEESLKQADGLLMWNCFFFPFLIACWSVVLGAVVSLTKLLGTKKSESSFSVYLLLVLVVILYILSVFPTSIGYFEYLLKIVCAVISFFVAIRLENNAIYDTLNDITPQENK